MPGARRWLLVVCVLLAGGVLPGAELDGLPKRVWLRADQGVEANPDGTVTRWLDQSGNGYHATVGTAVKPVWSNADPEWGGRARVRFSGTGYATLPGASLAGLTAAELIIVARSRAAAGTDNGWMRLGLNNVDRFPNAAGAWVEGFGFSTGAATVPLAGALSQPVVCSVSTQVNGRHVMRLNGLELRSATVAASITWPTSPLIGQSDRGFTGDVVEIIVLPGVVGDDVLLRVQQEVAARWGIGAVASAPVDVTATPLGAGIAEVSWSHAAVGSTIFRVERSADGVVWSPVQLVQRERRCVDRGATGLSEVRYRVRAESMAGGSAWAEGASLTLPAAGSPYERMRLWLRADIGTSEFAVTPGILNARWRDQSGLGNDAKVAAGAPAVGVEAVVAGEAMVRFDGSSHFVLPNCLTGLTAGEMVAVVRSRAPAGSSRGWSRMSGAPWTQFPGADGLWYESFGVPSVYTAAVTRTPLTQPVLCSVSVSANGWFTMRANGLVLRTVKAPATLSWHAAPNIGYGNQAFIGDIAEVQVFDRMLTDDERWSLSRGLNARYGLQPAPVAAPSLVSAEAVASTSVVCTWTYSGSDAARMRLERSVDGVVWALVGEYQDDHTVVDRNLTPGTGYRYRIRAEGIGGTSPWSDVLTVSTPADPTAYDRLRFWLRADAGTEGLANAVGGDGSLWRDQSRNGNDGTLVTGSLGATPEPAFNGRLVMRFPGSSYVRLPACLTGLSGAELVAVVRTRAPAGTSRGWSQIGGAWSTQFPGADGQWYEGFGMPTTYAAAVTRTPVTEPVLCSMSVSAGGWFTMRANGLVLRTVKAGATLSWHSNVVLGYGNQAFLGDIAEVMAFDRLLTDDERWSLSRDLSGRFALKPPPAATPSLVSAEAVASTSVVCTWAYAGSDPVRVRLERSVDGTLWSLIGEYQDDHTVVDRNLTPGTTYRYRIRAEGIGGTSPWSDAVAVTTPTNPTAYDRLRFWLRADAGTEGLANAVGGDGSLWRDQSRNGNDGTLVTGSLGATPEPAFNGRLVMRFPGSSYVRLPACLTGLSGAELVAVVRTRAPAGTSRGWSQIGGAWSTQFPGVDGQWYEGFGMSSTVSASVTRTPLTDPVLCSMSVSAGGVFTMRANGLVLRTVKAPATLSWHSNVVLGYGNQAFLGDIAEVMAFDQVLTDDQRWLVLRDLNARYVQRPQPTAAVTVHDLLALSGSRIDGRWSYAGSDPVRVRIERSQDGVVWTLVGEYADVGAFLDRDLAAGTTYRYRARAEGVGGAGAWSPEAVITTCAGPTPLDGARIWLRGDSASVGYDLETGRGDTNAVWSDLSGNGNHAVANGGSRVVTDAGFQGRLVMGFDNAGYYRLPNCLTGVTAGELVFVARSRGVAGTENGWMQFGSGSQSRFPGADGLWYESFGQGTSTGVNLSLAPINSPVLCSVSNRAGGQQIIRANGIELQRVPAPASLSWAVSPIIGWGSWRCAGDMAEVLVFPTVLSDAERRFVYDYCAERYASAPQYLTATPHAGRIVLQWDGWDLPASVLRRVPDGAWETIAATASGRWHADATAARGVTYEYQVTLGWSRRSPVAVATIPADWTVPSVQVAVQPGAAMETEGSLPLLLDRGRVDMTRGDATGWVVEEPTGAPIGAQGVRIAGGQGSFLVGDSVRFGASDVDYRVVDVGVMDAGRLQLFVGQPEHPERGLLQAVSDRMQVTISTTMATYRWSWSPAADGSWQVLAEGAAERRRSLTGTDSDPWAYTAGSFTDRWGRPVGDYPIRLEVANSAGVSAQTTLSARVVRGSAPVASAVLQEVPGAGGPPAFFDARGSNDDYGIVEYWWDVDTAVDSDGNGVPDDDRDLCGPTPCYLYATAGTRSVRLTVTDGAGQTASTTIACTVVADAPPVAAIVPFTGDAGRPIPAITGRATQMAGTLRDAGAITYRWDFGDGSTVPADGQPLLTAPADGNVAVEHAYALPPGAEVTLRLIARDAAGQETSVSRQVRIGVNSDQARTDEAIRRGLWFLHGQQLSGAPAGRWGGQRPCDAAMVLHALSLHGHRPFGDSRRDPLATSAYQAMTWMWSKVNANTAYAGATNRGFPDANGRALDVADTHQPYQTGMVMDAVVAALDAPAPVLSTASHLRGRRAIDVARDMQDMYAWGQSSLGGWRYEWRISEDNSACQWAAIGCLGLEQEYGLHAPDIVKTRNLAWLAASRNAAGLFGYDGNASIVNNASATTPSALVQLSWCGQSRFSREWLQAEEYLFNRCWQSNYLPNPEADTYGLFALVKAMRLARPQAVVQLAGMFNWYEDPANGIRARLLGTQKSDGSWVDAGYLFSLGGAHPTRPTAWSLIMLSPGIFSQQRTLVGNRSPVAAAKAVVVPTAPGLATAEVAPSAVDDGSTDPDGDRLTFRLVPPGPYPVGTNAVTLIVTDVLGVADAAETTITVEDREVPRVTAPAAITVSTVPGGATAALTALGRAVASDNVGVVALTATGPAGGLPVGVHTVVWEARDAAGNRGTANQQVTVVDTELPTIAAPPPVVVWLPIGTETATPALGTPVTSDNVAVTAVANDAPAAFPIGLHEVRWTARDAAGNTATAVQRVDVRQGTARPVAYLTSPGDGITFLAGSAIHLTAGVAYAEVTDVERVEFLLDGAIVAEDRTAPFAGLWPSAAAGDHRLQVRVRFRTVDHGPLPESVLSTEHMVHVVPADAVTGGQP